MSEPDAPLAHYGPDEVVVTELTDRQYLALFAKRPGMYIGRTSLRGVVGFLNGYDFATRRPGGLSLEGFEEWLLANRPCQGGNLAWWALINQIAIPEWDFVTAPTSEQEAHVLEVLFDLLGEFLAYKEHDL
ncbi:hypothetical protein [Nocardia sp. NPDC127526]|uniref:hypothetical protein n=1 Tax=Nocardia sp. NPDC127526 TaxID=3345393 RepID=UPI0036269BB8